MKTIKIVIPVIVILLLCGCNSNTRNSADDFYIGFYTDSKTCVEYIKDYGHGITVRYNTNGTIKLNMECLNEKDD